MFATVLIASVITVVAYSVCRSLLLTQLRVDNPELLAKLQEAQIGSPWLLGITISDRLLDRFDDPSLQVAPTSPVWKYVKLMRLCIVLLVLFWVAGLFALL